MHSVWELAAAAVVEGNEILPAAESSKPSGQAAELAVVPAESWREQCEAADSVR